MKQLGLKLVLIYNTGGAGYSLTHCATMQTPTACFCEERPRDTAMLLHVVLPAAALELRLQRSDPIPQILTTFGHFDRNVMTPAMANILVHL